MLIYLQFLYSFLLSISPSGCTFWGKKPWSRKKKILWQLGTLVGAPVGIALIAGIAIPAMIIGIPVYVGRKVKCATTPDMLQVLPSALCDLGNTMFSWLSSPALKKNQTKTETPNYAKNPNQPTPDLFICFNFTGRRSSVLKNVVPLKTEQNTKQFPVSASCLGSSCMLFENCSVFNLWFSLHPLELNNI